MGKHPPRRGDAGTRPGGWNRPWPATSVGVGRSPAPAASPRPRMAPRSLGLPSGRRGGRSPRSASGALPGRRQRKPSLPSAGEACSHSPAAAGLAQLGSSGRVRRPGQRFSPSGHGAPPRALHVPPPEPIGPIGTRLVLLRSAGSQSENAASSHPSSGRGAVVQAVRLESVIGSPWRKAERQANGESQKARVACPKAERCAGYRELGTAAREVGGS